MKWFPNISRRLAGSRIEAIGYDSDTGFVVIRLEGGGSLLISADCEGYHVHSSGIVVRECGIRPSFKSVSTRAGMRQRLGGAP